MSIDPHRCIERLPPELLREVYSYLDDRPVALRLRKRKIQILKSLSRITSLDVICNETCEGHVSEIFQETTLAADDWARIRFLKGLSSPRIPQMAPWVNKIRKIAHTSCMAARGPESEGVFIVEKLLRLGKIACVLFSDLECCDELLAYRMEVTEKMLDIAQCALTRADFNFLRFYARIRGELVSDNVMMEVRYVRP